MDGMKTGARNKEQTPQPSTYTAINQVISALHLFQPPLPTVVAAVTADVLKQ